MENENAVREALNALSNAVSRARDQLMHDSTELRRTQDRALDDVRSWVYDANSWFGARNTDACVEFHERINSIDGAWMDRDDGTLALEYNIEEAMDDYTGSAMQGIEEALDGLRGAIMAEPVLDNTPEAAAAREIAGVFLG